MSNSGARKGTYYIRETTGRFYRVVLEGGGFDKKEVGNDWNPIQ